MPENAPDEGRSARLAKMLKTPSSTYVPRASRRKWIPGWLLMAGVILGGLGLGMAAVSSSGVMGPPAAKHTVLTEKVRRGELLISVAEDGNLESSHNMDIKCEIKGGSTILWIIPDGTEVQKGDELVRLDSAFIEDQLNVERIAYAKAKAAEIDSKKSFDAADIAVNEYIQGVYVQTRQQLEANATLAKENKQAAQNLLEHMIKMARKGYVTALQRDAQAFAVEKADLDLQVAETALNVLEKYTRDKTAAALKATAESAKARNTGDRAALELEQSRVDRLETQLKKCLVAAPDNGMVIYANDPSGRRNGGSGVQSSIEEGAIIRERQTMIKLPDLSQMQVRCTVHESKVDMLKPGMRARVHVQDHDFQGSVTSIASQPEPTDFFSGNVKEYATIVSVESDSMNLRPGMTAAVEILVDDLPNVLSVPVESVVEIGDKFYCWVNSPSGPERHPVLLGKSNNTRIEIRDGVVEGDDVLKNPRAAVADVRSELLEQQKVDVKARFGGESPVAAPVERRASSDAAARKQ